MKKLRRILVIVIWVVITGSVVTGLVLANEWQDRTTCQTVSLTLVRDSASRLVNEAEIMAALHRFIGPLKGKRLKDIPFRAIEDYLRSIPVVSSVDIYASLNGVIEIKAVQRKPVIKLFPMKGGTWYVDEFGYMFPAPKQHADRSLPVSGYLKGDFDRLHAFKIKEDTSKNYRTLRELYEFALYIDNHRVLSSLISQVFINSQGEMELVPLTGDHIVILGNLDDYEYRLDNLLLFYSKTAGKINYSKYNTINLKYRNQIILTHK